MERENKASEGDNQSKIGHTAPVAGVEPVSEPPKKERSPKQQAAFERMLQVKRDRDEVQRLLKEEKKLTEKEAIKARIRELMSHSTLGKPSPKKEEGEEKHKNTSKEKRKKMSQREEDDSEEDAGSSDDSSDGDAAAQAKEAKRRKEKKAKKLLLAAVAAAAAADATAEKEKRKKKKRRETPPPSSDEDEDESEEEEAPRQGIVASKKEHVKYQTDKRNTGKTGRPAQYMTAMDQFILL